ncbi:cytochrome ubiquinol oxidase subunit I [uncultured Desulfosarcina sp.]|uniref:cytochrome ubiquinol oxidase subunit I n=1 Tax=uncultured Desulfosarcina sp. TaxID=218289 RepID=UPI0029C7DB83|nr:cytochrome ubiquinol oxidase subunit I [uncultured Desulfosarcina sp.]
MFSNLDPVFLARAQFAFTVAYHIIFPSFTIGLASWLAVVEWRWLKTGNPIYEQVYRMWVKIFAVTFGMGVVSGVVLSYQFGTNWSVFSDKVGNVLGPLLGYEVLTAFFLEASFLGIMLFGWNRVSKKMHFAATLIVAVGTLISAFWILSANSWMQTPAGFREGTDGLLYPTDWIAVIFNPSFPYRFIHMVTAAYLTTAFVVGGIGGYYLWRGLHVRHARIMLGMAMIMAIFVAPMQLLFGDMHGLNTFEHQPAKVAAMEGIWETERGAGLRLFAWPDQIQERNRFEVTIPKLSSLILTHDINGEVKGLTTWARAERPPVAMVFWTFRIMVGLGMLMIATGLVALVLYLRKTLFTTRWFHLWCMAMTPSGFVAVLTGWFVTEVGRQPFIVYNVMRTSETISPVAGETVAISLAAFVAVYGLVFAAGAYYILKLIGKGPEYTEEEAYGDHGVKTPPLVTDMAAETGGKDV